MTGATGNQKKWWHNLFQIMGRNIYTTVLNSNVDMLWYSDSCFAIVYVWNQRDCETRACQKRTFEMPIGRMPTSIVMQQVVMQDLWTIWFKPCLWWIVNLCSYLFVCVVWSNSTALHVYLQQQIITNRLSTFSDHDLFIIFVFVVQYL